MSRGRTTFTGLLSLALGFGLTACSQAMPPFEERATPRAAVELRFAPESRPTLQKVVDVLDRTAIATMDVIPMLRTAEDAYSPISARTGLPTTLSDPDVLKATQTQEFLDFDRTILFANLRPQTAYRFEVRAYRQDGMLISDPASSSILLQTGIDDRPVMGQLRLALVSVPFSGTSSISLVEVPGTQPYSRVLLEFGKVSGIPEVFTPISSQSISEFRGALTLENLAPHTRYRGHATAFGGPDDITPLAVATCDIVVTHDDAPATASLRLVLP
ncbi:hypothetical protein D3C87_1074470 [compost metagenome]